MLKRIKETLTCFDSGGGIRAKLKSHHLLHSDKSTYTYFYKGKVRSLLYSPSIPLLGGTALLLVLGMMISPCSSADSAYAVTTEDLGNGTSVSLSILNNNIEVVDDEEVSTNVNVGQMSYIDNIVRVNTAKIGRYYVGVQTAEGSSNELTNEDGVTIGVVGDNKGIDDFSDNTWGYVLTSDTTASNDTLHYNTLPTYNTSNTLQYQSPDNPADGNHDLKLTFAAKIRADKPGGHYRTKAMVSVAVEAKALTLSEINSMQDMTSDVCANTGIGDTNTLTDMRDKSTYDVKKLSDGKCWMAQNLRIINKTIYSTDSDVTEDYTIPSSSNPWTDTDANANNAHYADNDIYGAYYTWYTATAGTGNASIATNGDEAPNSICPRGWRLPTGGSDGEFQALYDKGHSGWASNSYDGVSITGRWFGGTSSSSAGAAFLPAAGYVLSGLLNDPGSGGSYWSSTSYSTVDDAYVLYFGSGRVDPASNGNRYRGRSVRCVAR